LKAFAALIAGATLIVSASAWAAQTTVTIHLIDAEGVGPEIGTIRAEDTQYGLLLTPDLKGLPPGPHGFHVHENPDCGPKEKDGKTIAGGAAGGHYDPQGTGEHEGPFGAGHLGDLPVLVVGDDGASTIPVLAPRLEVADIKGRAVIVHAGGDNYSDVPKKLGGGGPRIACGMIE
jgi:Cu-Zn family superoxide dismutase